MKTWSVSYKIELGGGELEKYSIGWTDLFFFFFFGCVHVHLNNFLLGLQLILVLDL